MFCKDKGYKLNNFLRVRRATTFWKNFTWLLVYVSLNKKKTAAQQIIACSRSGIQKLGKLRNLYKVYNKDTGASSIDVSLVSLLLTLNIFRTLLWYFCYWLSAGKCRWLGGWIILVNNNMLPQKLKLKKNCNMLSNCMMSKV